MAISRWHRGTLESRPFRVRIPYPNGLYVSRIQVYNQRKIVAPHYHRDIEILLTIDAEGEIYIDGRRYDMPPNSLFVVPSEAVHAIKYISNRVLVLQLSTDEVFRLIKKLSGCSIKEFDNLIQRLPVDVGPASDRVKTLIMNLRREGSTNRNVPVSFAEIAAISEMLSLILPSKEKAESSIIRTDERIKRIIDVMESMDLSEGAILDNIARKAALSKFHLCRIFKKGTGMTVHSYLNTLRMSRASYRLLENSSISDVAYDFGFKSISHFIQTFRKTFGKTPKQWVLDRQDKKG